MQLRKVVSRWRRVRETSQQQLQPEDQWLLVWWRVPLLLMVVVAAFLLLGSLSGCGTAPGPTQADNPYSAIPQSLRARPEQPIPLHPTDPVKSSTTIKRTPAAVVPVGGS